MSRNDGEGNLPKVHPNRPTGADDGRAERKNDMARWYGSVQNRIEENRMQTDEIKVGTGMTEYLWSDTHPYEVVEVTDQKHIKVREMGHKLVGAPFSNDWEVFPDEERPVQTMHKRGKYWYFVTEYEEDGKTKRNFHRANVSFGVARYYYDYSF